MDEIGVDIDSRPILAQLLASIRCMFQWWISKSFVLGLCVASVPG